MQLSYGNEQVEINWPSTPVDVLSYRSFPSASDPEQLVSAALDQPIAAKRLSEIAHGKRNAVILISDITRLCPSYLFLPRLLNELNEGGIPDDRIVVITALGTHRQQTEEELLALAGEETCRRIRVCNHSSAEEDCIDIGITSRGTRVALNRIVVEADLRIATGNIEPHRLVGMSGGVKALFPGVASASSISQHHAMSQQIHAVPGDPNNPLHRDLEEVSAMVPVHFLVNVVVDHNRHPLGVFAGDPQQAHQEGVAFARERFLIPTSQTYDVVVASAGGAPKDIHLYQAAKSLENAAAFVKPGGKLLLLARCEEVYGNGTFQQWAEAHGDRERTIRKLQEQFVLGGHKLLVLHKVMQHCEAHLFSALSAPVARLLGFHPVPDPQQWVQLHIRPGMQAAMMPYASITFPAPAPK